MSETRNKVACSVRGCTVTALTVAAARKHYSATGHARWHDVKPVRRSTKRLAFPKGKR